MPSTIVKLSSADGRAWAHNQPVWLDEGGEVVRPVTREEQHAISKALERSRRVQHSFRLSLPLLAVTPSHTRRAMNGPRRPALPQLGKKTEMLDCAFEVTHLGQKRVVTVFHGKLRYATGREVLAARLLADHGECVLHGRNGKCIGVLRDPLIAEREPVTGRRVQWSRNPEDAKRAEQALLEGSSVSPVKQKKHRRHTGKPLYSPKNCPNDCRGYRGGSAWALAKNARPPTEHEHHPVCQYASSWAETLEPEPQSTVVLYDLELSRVMRAASESEIAEADETESRTGIRQVTVAGRIYAVLPRAEAMLAAREARGEADEGELPEALETASEVLDPVEPAAPAKSTDSERQAWPELDEVGRGRAPRVRETVTPRDYLSRPAPSEAGPSA